MTLPIGPFRVAVTISRRCREALGLWRFEEATDGELARLATGRAPEAELIRFRAEQALVGPRLA